MLRLLENTLLPPTHTAQPGIASHHGPKESNGGTTRLCLLRLQLQQKHLPPSSPLPHARRLVSGQHIPHKDSLPYSSCGCDLLSSSASRVLSVVQGSPSVGSPNTKCKTAEDGWMEIGEGERKGKGETKRHTQLAGAHLQLLGGLFPLIKHLAVLPVL